MLFNWDGNSDGGTNLPPGVYYYYITAQTNGQPLLAPPGGGGGGSSPPAPAMSTSIAGSDSIGDGWYPTSAKQAIAAGWDYYYLPPPPMPPVWTNGVWMDWEDVYDPRPLTKVDVSLLTQKLFSHSLSTANTETSDVATPQDSSPSDYSGASARAAPPAPDRPPTAPKVGTVGTFGIAYQTYKANGTNGFTPALPLSTPGLQTRIQMEGQGTANPPNFGPLRIGDTEAIFFGAEMAGAA